MPPNPPMAAAVYRCNSCGLLLFTDPIHEERGFQLYAHKHPVRTDGFTYVGLYRLEPKGSMNESTAGSHR